MIGKDSLDSPFVKSKVKSLVYLCSDGCPGEAKFGSLVDNEANDLRGNLVGFFLPCRFAGQACEPLSPESLQSLIEGFSGVTEFSTDSSNEALLIAVCAEHFVLDLGGVPGVEKIGGLEQI